jgi:beta-xylosidase
VHADRTSFTGRDLQRVVETGDVVLQLGATSEDIRLEAPLRLTGDLRTVGADRVLTTPVEVSPR